MGQDNHSLTLYFIPSPGGMDWSSPSSLALTTLKNRISLKPRFLGHVFVEVKSGETREITGMVGKRFDYFNQVIVEQKGLGVLYHSFEGQLENAKDIDQEIQILSQMGDRLNFMKFLLHPENAARLMEYLTQYREMNIGRNYGLSNRPRHGEGAGCSAFGASFLEVAGLLDPHIKDSWSHSINIPKQFSGPPLNEDKVNILKVLFNAKRWAHDHEPHHKLHFWEPDRMFRWVKEKIDLEHEHDMKVAQLGKALGLIVDKTEITPPDEPIFFHGKDDHKK